MNTHTNALDRFRAVVKENVISFADLLTYDYYTDAIKLICDAESNGGRLHVTGIGKPSHVAEYSASLLSSIGTPTYYLHGTEAVHGSCGQLVTGDVVICISNSGETTEMKATVVAIKNNGCKIIGISGNSESWLASQSDVFLAAKAENEGGPMNRAPISSIIVEEMVLQGLGVALQERIDFSPEDYVRRHPGGSLGRLRDGEK